MYPTSLLPLFFVHLISERASRDITLSAFNWTNGKRNIYNYIILYVKDFNAHASNETMFNTWGNTNKAFPYKLYIFTAYVICDMLHMICNLHLTNKTGE